MGLEPIRKASVWVSAIDAGISKKDENFLLQLLKDTAAMAISDFRVLSSVIEKTIMITDEELLLQILSDCSNIPSDSSQSIYIKLITMLALNEKSPKAFDLIENLTSDKDKIIALGNILTAQKIVKNHALTNASSDFVLNVLTM
jgi:hypothetical protein